MEGHPLSGRLSLALAALILAAPLAALWTAAPARAQADGCVNPTFTLAEKSWNATEAVPGASFRGEYEVVLDSDGGCKKTFNLSAALDNENWSASVSPESFDLCAGELCAVQNPDLGTSGRFNVTVTVANAAVAAEPATVTVKAVDGTPASETDDNRKTAPKDLTASQVYLFSITCDGTALTAGKGGSVSFNVSVTQGGNGHDDVTLAATAGTGLTVTFDPAMLKVHQPGDGHPVTVQSNATVTVASDAKAGSYTIAVTGTSAGDATATATCSESLTVSGGGGDGGGKKKDSPAPPVSVTLVVLAVAFLARRSGGARSAGRAGLLRSRRE